MFLRVFIMFNKFSVNISIKIKRLYGIEHFVYTGGKILFICEINLY
jgi:hypothetical protein